MTTYFQFQNKITKEKTWVTSAKRNWHSARKLVAFGSNTNIKDWELIDVKR